MKHLFVIFLSLIPICLTGQMEISFSDHRQLYPLRPKHFSFKPIHPFSSSYNNEDEEGRNIVFSPGLEVWYSRWTSFSYVSETSIVPSWLYCPSFGLKINHFKFNFNFHKSVDVNNVHGIIGSLKANEINILEGGVKFLHLNDKPLFDSEIWYGKYTGSAVWSGYKDTIMFTPFVTIKPIDARMFYLDFLPNSGLVGTTFMRMFGLRFLHYNAPASLIGPTIPDPRNPLNNLVWLEVADTKFYHVFFILNSGRIFERLIEARDKANKGKKVSLNFDFHWYTLLLGLGWGRNEPMGRFFSFSTPNASSQIGGLVLNMELDFGPKLIFRFKNDRDLTAKLALRWTDWELVSAEKRNLQARSKDRFFGPYFKVYSHL